MWERFWNRDNRGPGPAPACDEHMLTIGELAFDAPAVMGILNVTPDSFSDGGRFVGRDAALRQAETMARDGAAVIDIGGESTRPGAADVSAQEELHRVLPVIEAVTAGVAFLAAGVIFTSGDKVRNLTTGASMWLAGAIGLACGAGQAPLAALATLMVTAVLIGLRWLEKGMGTH